MQNHLIQYPKSKCNNERIGALVALKDEDTGSVFVGWSKYNRDQEAIPFDKYHGLMIAENRALCDRRVYQIDDVPFAIRNDVVKFVDRAKRYFRVSDIANFSDN